MAIVESRLKNGVLALGVDPGALDFSCQVTNARIGSTYDDDGDAVETLCGDQIPAGRKLGGRSLAGTFIQDWTAPAAESITDYCYVHDLEIVAFEYTPNEAGPTLSGELRIEVPSETYGGDVNTRITSDFEWSLTAPLVRTPPAAAALSAEEQDASATSEPTPEGVPA
jgi:hypothetical protein